MQNWKKFALIGLALIVFGLVVLGNAGFFSIAISTITGLMLVLAGVALVVSGVSAPDILGKVLIVVMGILLTLMGWSLISHPLDGVIKLTHFVIILFIASGLVRLFWGFSSRGSPYFWPLLVSGLASILLAFIVLRAGQSSPEALFGFLGMLMGIELLLSGVSFVSMGFFLRSKDK